MFKKFFYFFIFFYSNQLIPVDQKAISNTQEFKEWKKKYLCDLAAENSDVIYSNLEKLKIGSEEKRRKKVEIFTKLLEEIEKKYSLKENEHLILQAYSSFVPWEEFMKKHSITVATKWLL